MLRQFSKPTLLCQEQLFLDSMVVQDTCPDRSCRKQLRIYHARHQPSLGFSGATNVGHEPSQSTLDCFGSRNMQVFAEAKPSIQLYTQVLNSLFHSISCSPSTIFGYLKDLLSVTSKASDFSRAIFRHLLSNQRYARHRLSLILSSRVLTSLATRDP